MVNILPFIPIFIVIFISTMYFSRRKERFENPRPTQKQSYCYYKKRANRSTVECQM
jgi:hypothetical protein